MYISNKEGHNNEIKTKEKEMKGNNAMKEI
jgi:hypothetical protein